MRSGGGIFSVRIQCLQTLRNVPAEWIELLKVGKEEKRASEIEANASE